MALSQPGRGSLGGCWRRCVTERVLHASRAPQPRALGAGGPGRLLLPASWGCAPA